MSIRRKPRRRDATSWNVIATLKPCAARRISPRRHQGKSAAGATDFPAKRWRVRHWSGNRQWASPGVTSTRGRGDTERVASTIQLQTPEGSSVEKIRRVIDDGGLHRHHLSSCY